jgi:hypothetical protein
MALALKEHCHSEHGFDIGKFERVLKEMTLSGTSTRKLRRDRKVSYEWASEVGSSRAKNRIHSSQW